MSRMAICTVFFLFGCGGSTETAGLSVAEGGATVSEPVAVTSTVTLTAPHDGSGGATSTVSSTTERGQGGAPPAVTTASTEGGQGTGGTTSAGGSVATGGVSATGGDSQGGASVGIGGSSTALGGNSATGGTKAVASTATGGTTAFISTSKGGTSSVSTTFVPVAVDCPRPPSSASATATCRSYQGDYTCVGDTCTICDHLYLDCDGDPRNGCEVKRDMDNCSFCGDKCSGGRCGVSVTSTVDPTPVMWCKS